MIETKPETEEEFIVPPESIPPEEGVEPAPKVVILEEKRTITPPAEELPKESIPKESVSEVLLQPSPVPGETGREHALRLEIERLRTKLRGESVKEVIETTSIKQVADPYKELRDKGYNDDEIKQMEIAVDLIAKNKGYVRADDSYKQSINNTVDVFVDEHPEYNPANDINDLRWTHFQSILQGGIYNLFGKTPKQLKAIFSKVDEDVKKEMGEPITVTNKQQLAAQQHKINIASHSGGTTTIQKPESKIDLTQPIGGVKFKGFDSEDF